MFTYDDASMASMEVDLVVSGVWVPVATALMADPGIKTAIFSPGIANILQVRHFSFSTCHDLGISVQGFVLFSCSKGQL
jgi:hypothetical protein